MQGAHVLVRPHGRLRGMGGREPVEEQLWTQRQAARYLHVAVRTLQLWHAQGKAPPSILLPSGARRYRKSALDAWIREHERDS
jgi:hypothetical protein